MRKKSKNLLVLVVLLAIIGIAVGYAALSQTLTLTGTATVLSAADWKVHFNTADVTTAPKTVPASATVELDSTKLSGTFAATLAPGEKAVYTVTVINEGRIGASLDSIADAVQTKGNVTCTVTPDTQTTPIANNDTHEYVVTLQCANLETLANDTETQSFTVDFNYVQTAEPQS